MIMMFSDSHKKKNTNAKSFSLTYWKAEIKGDRFFTSWFTLQMFPITKAGPG